MTRPDNPDEPMPPVGGTIRPPDVDLPPEQLGSTAQFKAFATGTESDTSAEQAPPAQRRHPATERAEQAARPTEAPESPSESTAAIQPPGLPPVRNDSKRGLYLALAVVVLVAVVIALLLILL